MPVTQSSRYSYAAVALVLHSMLYGRIFYLGTTKEDAAAWFG